ncbi:MAG: restriction endonuclease [Gemmatimonadaceae bacterium]|nr:restriction endonuclease [Gemmatimonadaceae bacterium]
MNLRADQQLHFGDGERHHIADVAQGWPVDGYKRVDLSRLPGWLRNSMFGRSTFGQFKDHPLNPDTVTAHKTLSRLLDGQSLIPTSWTLEPEEIRRRLVDTLNPSAFENLVVSLLQLENPKEIWHQTGGPGDGGIDGIGSNEDGEITGLMQAKLNAWDTPELTQGANGDYQANYYAAVLIPDQPIPPTDGTILLDLQWITAAVRRHYRSLPQARAMRIGPAK